MNKRPLVCPNCGYDRHAILRGIRKANISKLRPESFTKTGGKYICLKCGYRFADNNTGKGSII